MGEKIMVGDRVQWTEKDKRRRGTVVICKAWNSKAYVKPDRGNPYPVDKDKLSKIEGEG